VAIYIDDKELVAAHQAGDTEAFEELVRQYRSALHAHGRRKLSCDAAAEDAVQETLVRAYKALPRFNGQYKLGPWLHRILANVCIDEANRRKRDGEKVIDIAAQPFAGVGSPSVEEELGFEFDDSKIRSALEQLPTSQRDALLLRFVDELEYDQLAKVSGVSEQNARARVSRARSAMRVALKGVAAAPVFLIGLVRKGEKVAAAATGGSTAASAISQSAPSSVSVIAEATTIVGQTAPAVVPVVTKAAVGIGLVAAVFTPTADSTVHQAVRQFTSADPVQLVETDSDTDLRINEGIGEGASGQFAVTVDGVLIDGTDTANAEVPQQQTETPAEVVPVAVRTFVAAQQESDQVPTLENASEGSLVGQVLEFLELGAGRYQLSGSLAFNSGGVSHAMTLATDSWVRISGEADSDGRYRVDGFIELEDAEGSAVMLRLAGFALSADEERQLVGLYQLEDSTNNGIHQGEFAGSMSTDASIGSLVLNLAP
jgi:RNA polymerase sigma-70 factor (ECF subfamily)